jgi:carbonic anhydrase
VVVEAFQDLVESNADYADGFAHGALPAPPRRHLAVVTCMDARIDVYQVLGLEPGDAHVLRNAGARTTDDVVRSLIKSIHQLGVTRVAIVHHTDCGAAKIQLDVLRSQVAERTGHDPVDVDFHLIADEDQSIVDDVEALAASPYLPAGIAVAGFMYDVRTGRLDPRHSATVGGFTDAADLER